jgi:hypothetical protein
MCKVDEPATVRVKNIGSDNDDGFSIYATFLSANQTFMGP